MWIESCSPWAGGGALMSPPPPGSLGYYHRLPPSPHKFGVLCTYNLTVLFTLMNASLKAQTVKRMNGPSGACYFC